MKQNSPESLPPFADDKGTINAIVETPKDSRNKFKWDTKHQLYKLSNVLPSGNSFPYDFGFIPSTEGQDGDPIDVLIFMDEPAFPGCLVTARLIGVIEAEQEKGERNDRLIAIATEGHIHTDVDSIDDLSDEILKELEGFFTSYHATRGEPFKVIGRKGPKHAVKLVKKASK